MDNKNEIVKSLIKRTMLLAMLAFACVLVFPMVSSAKAKKPTLQHKKIFVGTNDTAAVTVYNANSKPKWSVKNKSLVELRTNGARATISASRKTGKTKLICKVGKTTLVCDIIVYDSFQKVSKKSVTYKIKKVGDAACKVTITNKNAFPVIFCPGIALYNSQFVEQDHNTEEFVVPAKSTITEYVCLRLSVFDKEAAMKKICKESKYSVIKRLNGNAYKVRNITVSDLHYSFDTYYIYANLKNKFNYQTNVNGEILVYKDGKLFEIFSINKRLKAKEKLQITESFGEANYPMYKGSTFTYKVNLTTMGDEIVYY